MPQSKEGPGFESILLGSFCLDFACFPLVCASGFLLQLKHMQRGKVPFSLLPPGTGMHWHTDKSLLPNDSTIFSNRFAYFSKAMPNYILHI